VLEIVKCSVLHTIVDLEQAISTTSENYLGKPFRSILVLFRVKWSVFDNVVIFVFFLIDLEDDIRTLDLVMLLQQVED
jgi:hypothetical protein